MASKHKPGALSREEMKFIEDNAKLMGVVEIAEAINKKEGPVKRYLDSVGIIAKSEDEDDEDTEIRARLIKEDFWAEVYQQFSTDELKYFASTWVSMVKQFQSDILASEKLQLKKFITYEILRDRVLKKNARYMTDIEELEAKIRAEYDKMRVDRDSDMVKSMTDQMVSMRASISNSVREINDYSKEQNVIAKELKASRSDRISNIQDAEQNWVSLIKLFEDDGVRKKIGTHIEIMRAAQKKAKEKLYGFHHYADNQKDIPILDSKSAEAFESQKE